MKPMLLGLDPRNKFYSLEAELILALCKSQIWM